MCKQTNFDEGIYEDAAAISLVNNINQINFKGRDLAGLTKEAGISLSLPPFVGLHQVQPIVPPAISRAIAWDLSAPRARRAAYGLPRATLRRDFHHGAPSHLQGHGRTVPGGQRTAQGKNYKGNDQLWHACLQRRVPTPPFTRPRLNKYGLWAVNWPYDPAKIKGGKKMLQNRWTLTSTVLLQLVWRWSRWAQEARCHILAQKVCEVHHPAQARGGALTANRVTLCRLSSSTAASAGAVREPLTVAGMTLDAASYGHSRLSLCRPRSTLTLQKKVAIRAAYPRHAA